MRVLVIGASGGTGSRVTRRLRDGPHEPVAMIREEEQAPRFEEAGVETVLADLEEPVDHALEGCDAAIFAAGSGAETGLDKTVAVDRDGAVRSMVAAEKEGVGRYVMLSAMGADPGSEGHRMSPYWRAKGIADLWLARSGMTHTVVRPGSLTDEEGTGEVDASEALGRSGSVPREDVAHVLVACLEVANVENRTFELLEGDTPVRRALETV